MRSPNQRFQYPTSENHSTVVIAGVEAGTFISQSTLPLTRPAMQLATECPLDIVRKGVSISIALNAGTAPGSTNTLVHPEACTGELP